MLRQFSVTNYKNFKERLVWDFSAVGGYQFNKDCLTNNYLGKSIVFGRNATGKTNLGKALVDIRSVLLGLPSRGVLDTIANADQTNMPVIFDYIFVFDSITVEYKYSRNMKRTLIDEQLIIDEKTIFSYSSITNSFDALDLDSLNAGSLNIDNYVNPIGENGEASKNSEDDGGLENNIPFLRYLFFNSALDAESPLMKMGNFVARMIFSSVNEQIGRLNEVIYGKFYDYLSNEDNLQDFQTFLNALGVDCKLRIDNTVDGHHELFFDYEVPIAFYENASSGTISLTNFYRRHIANVKKPSFIYLDEFDAFYNYEMSEMLVKYLKTKCPNTQVVLTTHNTNLISNSIFRPDCLFVLSHEGKLTALCDATERELREGHNLEKLYIGGEFDQYE